jgi:anti-sigma-K factor RskA
MSEDRFGNLLGPYVLGQLSADEEREVDEHLRGCPRCRTELEDVRQAHVLLRRAAAIAPPPDLKEWVMAQASGEAGGESAAGRGRRLWVAVSAAALLVAVVLGIGIFLTTVGDTSEGLPLTATAAAPGASGELRGEEVEENLRVELVVRNLPTLRKHEYYEMWYAREGKGRVSCGTFRVGPSGDATVSMSAPASAVAYPEIEVTREPDDGNPEASGDTVLVGNLRDFQAGTPEHENTERGQTYETPRAYRG